MVKLKTKVVKNKPKKISIAGIKISDKGNPFTSKLEILGLKMEKYYIIQSLDYHVDVQDGCLSTMTLKFYKKPRTKK